MKILIPDSKTITLGDISFDRFKEFGEVEIYELSGAKLMPERSRDTDIILCNKVPMNAETLRNAKNLKYIGLFATGYNNIDLEYCKSRNITVCNAAGYSTDAVAQHTFALILDHYSRINEYNNFVQDGGWKRSDTFSPFVYGTHELFGKTIGIVEFGTIGKRVAQIAAAFGMNIVYYSRSEKEFDGAVRLPLEELVQVSDIVTVHCPLNDESRGMFDDELFSKFKPTAFFVNTARGGIADEQSLRRALESGKIAGAAADVLVTEPMGEDCPLIGVKNMTLTPHTAWAAKETRERCVQQAYETLKAYLNGKPINVVSR